MIKHTRALDVRYPLANGAGSDAVHRHPIYAYSVTLLENADHQPGVGLTFTLGDGNELVCQAAEHIAQSLRGREIEDVMSDLGSWQRRTANDERYRWLGPHKGVVHLALASVTNACWDLWAKERRRPLVAAVARLVARGNCSHVGPELSRRRVDAGIRSGNAPPAIAESPRTHWRDRPRLSRLRYIRRLV